MFSAKNSFFTKQAAAGYDADAQAFFTAAAITNATQKTAVNNLVVALKGYGIWAKMAAIYPLVGGTASTCKYNLKDPRDLDAAYRLTFTGGNNLVISATGIQSLTTAPGVFANTKFNPTTVGFTKDNIALSWYSRTNNANGSYDMGGDMIGSKLALIVYGVGAYLIAYGVFGAGVANSLGFYAGSSTNIQQAVYKNGTKIAFVGAVGSSTIDTNVPIYLLANPRQYPTETSTREFAYASIGTGLTDAEQANHYTAVQAYQTTLGRQV